MTSAETIRFLLEVDRAGPCGWRVRRHESPEVERLADACLIVKCRVYAESEPSDVPFNAARRWYITEAGQKAAELIRVATTQATKGDETP